MKRYFTIVALLLLTAGTATAFDGHRKGFVLGAGIGYSPTVKTAVTATAAPGTTDEFNLGSVEGSEQGMAFQLIFGYAFNDHSMLVYEGNASWYYYENVVPDDNLDIAQGFHSLMLYHYWGSVGSSFFTAAGAGLTYWDTNYSDRNQGELGYLVGAGFEFTPHLQVGAYYGSGTTKNANFPGVDFEGTHSNVSILLTAIAF